MNKEIDYLNEVLSILLISIGVMIIGQASDSLLDPIGWFGMVIVLYGMIRYILVRGGNK